MDYLKKQGDAPDPHQQVKARYHEVWHVANEFSGKICPVCKKAAENEDVPPPNDVTIYRLGAGHIIKETAPEWGTV
jgi:hypothetical protein